MLVGHSASSADGLQVAAFAAAHSERLGYLVAHRPGFMAPTMAARAFATLDRFSGGRVAVHTVSGGSEADQARDGDHLDKEGRYRRTDEYLEVMERTWTAEEPFDHRGEFYDVADVNAVRAAGAAAAHPDLLRRLVGGGLPRRREARRRLRALGRAAGRDRGADRRRARGRARRGPVDDAPDQRLLPPDPRHHGGAGLGRAHDVLDRIVAADGGGGSFTGRTTHRQGHETTRTNAGSQRLLAAAERGELHDRALWTPTAAASGAAGNSTALVGTPETVAAALLDYVDIGATTFLLRGYDPLDDVADYGRRLLPLVREELARRERVPA